MRMSTSGRCPHECTCRCHRAKGTKHVTACCRPCGLCSRNIIFMLLERHKEKCHTEEEREREVTRYP